MSIKYGLIIYWSEDDKASLVEVPELPGCMADGETYEQAATQCPASYWEMDWNRPRTWPPNPYAEGTVDVCVASLSLYFFKKINIVDYESKFDSE